MVCAAFSISAAFLIGISARISASGMLGVRTSAIGSRFAHRALTASSRRSLEPDVATMTGSTTICFAPYCFSLAAIVSMSSAEETIPILTASGVISVNTASSCSARKMRGRFKDVRHAGSVLGGQGRDRTHGVNAVGGHGLDVCLDTGLRRNHCLQWSMLFS